MRGRIALRKHFVRNLSGLLLCFATALECARVLAPLSSSADSTNSQQFALPGSQQRYCSRAVGRDGLEGATRRDE